jgi:hypothetical protein
MAVGKLSSFIISILLVAMFVGVFSIFISKMGEGYGTPTSVNESELAVFNKFDKISQDAAEIQNDVNAVSDRDNPFDIIGNYFSAAWGSVTLAGSTVDVVAGSNGSIVESATDKMDLGEGGEVIGGVATTIIIVLVVIGILVSVLIKRDL